MTTATATLEAFAAFACECCGTHVERDNDICGKCYDGKCHICAMEVYDDDIDD